MFSIELLAWGSLAVSVVAFVVAAVVYRRVSDDCRRIESELEWSKSGVSDLNLRILKVDDNLHDLARAAGFKLASPGPKVRFNAWEKAL